MCLKKKCLLVAITPLLFFHLVFSNEEQSNGHLPTNGNFFRHPIVIFVCFQQTFGWDEDLGQITKWHTAFKPLKMILELFYFLQSIPPPPQDPCLPPCSPQPCLHLQQSQWQCSPSMWPQQQFLPTTGFKNQFTYLKTLHWRSINPLALRLLLKRFWWRVLLTHTVPMPP